MPRGTPFLGVDIVRLRTQRNWSQEDLAVASGVAIRTIRRAEAGLHITPDIRAAIASALNIRAPDDGMEEARRVVVAVEKQGGGAHPVHHRRYEVLTVDGGFVALNRVRPVGQDGAISLDDDDVNAIGKDGFLRPWEEAPDQIYATQDEAIRACVRNNELIRRLNNLPITKDLEAGTGIVHCKTESIWTEDV